MSAAMKIPTDTRGALFDIDAALRPQRAPRYSTELAPWAELKAQWARLIANERLTDVVQPSLQTLRLDSRDGALTRGKGGLAYTPRAWGQLISLLRAEKDFGYVTEGAPNNMANCLRWLAPSARSPGLADVIANSLRAPTDEAVLRCMIVAERGRQYTAVRAIVSGRHGLTHFDDSNVLATMGRPEMVGDIESGYVSRSWDMTYGSFTVAGGTHGCKLGFGLTNSETGCASLGMMGELRITALDAVVAMPDGRQYEKTVEIMSARNGTRRRHTLPRFDSRDGERLTETQRHAIAQKRIAADVEKALTESRALHAKWQEALTDINVLLVPLAAMTAADESAIDVLADVLIEQGVEIGEDKALCGQLAKVIADDARLRELPAGSAAHMAAALAVLAQSAETWARARELQQMAGKFVLQGWSR